MTKNDVLYLETHEWIHIVDNQATVGISSYAAAHLGDIVFFDLPKVGATFKKGDAFGAVESVKNASDLYLPVSGKVIAVNEELLSNPDVLSQDPFGTWIIKIEATDAFETDDLLDVKAYEAQLE